MPGGRQTIPLFELLTRRQSSTPAAGPEPEVRPAPPPRPMASPTIDLPNRLGKPVVRVELRPRDVEEPKSTSYGPRPRWFTPLLGGAEIRVPVNLVYFGSAAVVLIMLGTWLGGVKWGRLDAERDYNELRAREARDGPVIIEPGAAPASVLAANQPKRGITPSPSTETGSPQLLGDLNAATITPKGLLQGDPREVELNYYALAELPRIDAEAAIAFLASNGVEAFAIPTKVDRRSPVANNANPGAATFRLYALPGITGKEWGQKQTKRTRLEGEVARLGAVWQREHRGSSNFAGALWEKYQ